MAFFYFDSVSAQAWLDLECQTGTGDPHMSLRNSNGGGVVVDFVAESEKELLLGHSHLLACVPNLGDQTRSY